MKSILYLLLLTSILVFSCQREINWTQEESPTCRIKTGIYLGGGGAYDSATFSYDASGRITKWQGNDGYYDYFYSNGRISARVFHDQSMSSGDIWYVDSARYDANGRITELVSYDYSGIWSPDTLHVKMLFNYIGEYPDRITNIEYHDPAGGWPNDTMNILFSWNAAGNMDKIVYLDDFGSRYDSALYQFDNNLNYFKQLHPHFFLLDPGFELQVGLEANFPYLYSRNNVTNINVYGSWDYPIVYGLDSTSQVTSLDMGGFPYIRYKYECP
jgi:hypothetical protein